MHEQYNRIWGRKGWWWITVGDASLPAWDGFLLLDMIDGISLGGRKGKEGEVQESLWCIRVARFR